MKNNGLIKNNGLASLNKLDQLFVKGGSLVAQDGNRETFCKSVFKSGEGTASQKQFLQKQFTRKWIKLINQLEKSKGTGQN